ncbi:hypothetical protein HMPREF9104_02140 [Lentilactobacillus kisonensis F0435]|uniref:Uncharacterized protein n=1 Tax=Lentilactobacillus kisonensis F0435 TaxID=797516 RepID=H1LHP9_9LACO|nr:hypothetical protein HMPREF9104_02140 [Lentilactobacillus kisonensis F0435]
MNLVLPGDQSVLVLSSFSYLDQNNANVSNIQLNKNPFGNYFIHQYIKQAHSFSPAILEMM